jgi:hypothetical protein
MAACGNLKDCGSTFCYHLPAARPHFIFLPCHLFASKSHANLHEEACVHLFGGREYCERFVETYWHERTTGRQPVKMIEEKMAFEITCKRDGLTT